MWKAGHFGLGLIASVPLVGIALVLSKPIWAVVLLGAGVYGGLIPDVDQKPLLPVKHHGITHTVLFGIVLAFFSALLFTGVYQVISSSLFSIGVLTNQPPVALLALFFVLMLLSVFFGVLSHLFGDALSRAGGTLLIRPYYPFSDNFVRFSVTTADDPYYNYGFLLGGGVVQVLIFYLASSLGLFGI